MSATLHFYKDVLVLKRITMNETAEARLGLVKARLPACSRLAGT